MNVEITKEAKAVENLAENTSKMNPITEFNYNIDIPVYKRMQNKIPNEVSDAKYKSFGRHILQKIFKKG